MEFKLLAILVRDLHPEKLSNILNISQLVKSRVVVVLKHIMLEGEKAVSTARLSITVVPEPASSSSSWRGHPSPGTLQRGG